MSISENQDLFWTPCSIWTTSYGNNHNYVPGWKNDLMFIYAVVPGNLWAFIMALIMALMSVSKIYLFDLLSKLNHCVRWCVVVWSWCICTTINSTCISNISTNDEVRIAGQASKCQCIWKWGLYVYVLHLLTCRWCRQSRWGGKSFRGPSPLLLQQSSHSHDSVFHAAFGSPMCTDTRHSS